jgi:hypothetical protein
MVILIHWDIKKLKDIEVILKEEEMTHEVFFKQHPKGIKIIKHWTRILNDTHKSNLSDAEILSFVLDSYLEAANKYL